MSQTEMGNMSDGPQGQDQATIGANSDIFDAAFVGMEGEEPQAMVADESNVPMDVSDLTIDIVPVESSAFDPVAIAEANRQDRAAAQSASADNKLLSDLQAQNQKLLAQNDEILGWVSELERSLEDAQAALLQQDEQAQRQEYQLIARNDELMTIQSRSAQLIQELENAQKLAQRQQILIETLTAQLDGAQERLAQMERECTLAQAHQAEQAHKLLQSEGTCRNLKSRLQRQQRYTLQFRAALEKCLEASVPQPIEDLTLGSPRIDPMEPIDTLGELLPKSKPVQPWSSRFELNMSDIEAIQREIKAVEDAETLGLSYELGEEPDEFPPMALRDANAELDDILRQTADRIPSFDPDSDWAGADELSTDADEIPSPELAAGLAAGLATIGLGHPTKPTAKDRIAQDSSSLGAALTTDPADSTVGIAPFNPDLNLFDAIAARAVESQPEPVAEVATQTQAIDEAIATDAISPETAEEETSVEEAALPEATEAEEPATPPKTSIRLDEIEKTDEQLLLDQILSRMTSTEPKPLSRSPLRTPAMAGVTGVAADANGIPDAVAAALGIQADWPAPVVHPLRAKKKLGSMASIDLPSFPKP
jgi:hypothetical protein